MMDEDADLRAGLAALGPDALRELQKVLTWPQQRRDDASKFPRQLQNGEAQRRFGRLDWG